MDKPWIKDGKIDKKEWAKDPVNSAWTNYLHEVLEHRFTDHVLDNETATHLQSIMVKEACRQGNAVNDIKSISELVYCSEHFKIHFVVELNNGGREICLK